MKTLFIIRHAKSSWAGIGESDFERPLNDRGKKDAPVMATRLLKKGKRPDLLLSSSALRTRQTATLFCKELGMKESDILYVDALYHATENIISNEVGKMKDSYDCVALFTHNPGITEYANMQCEEVYIDNMPTCGIFAVEADVKSWNEFAEAKKKFLFFDYPKNS